jgi:hypothetical protein
LRRCSRSTGSVIRWMTLDLGIASPMIDGDPSGIPSRC